MKHLILSREYPPAPYPAGGIGTYVSTISRLLAEAGETVHVIGQRWPDADAPLELRCGGRLVIHRVGCGDRDPAPQQPSDVAALDLLDTQIPAQWFSWRAGRLAETLIESEGIDAVEGQDWEAPLYYLLLRRALGLGPRRRAPCIVHLHSPTEFIFRANEWDLGRPDYLPVKRLEDYVIAAADARLCPSHSLARQAEAHYGLPAGSVHVIPYPVGETTALERSPETWRRGSVCYVGRLEPRKGVIEWVEAAASVALEHPEVAFEFIGADLPYANGLSVRQFAGRAIPAELRPRFRFRGALPRPAVRDHLRQARAAVVPSRWENFPNTCIEAMASGLPVIASSNGGMVEMIVDGETGWLAAAGGQADLADALRRMLATPPDALATMGRRAADAIRRQCDNGATVEAQIEFRARTARAGAGPSLFLPTNLPRTAPRPTAEPVPRQAGAGMGVAVVVTCLDHGDLLHGALESIAAQTHSPTAVVVVAYDPTRAAASVPLAWARARGWTVVTSRQRDAAAVRNAGIATLRQGGVDPLAWVLVDGRDRLRPGAVSAYATTFAHCSDVGLISSWMRHSGREDRVATGLCPAFPYQWLFNDVAPSYAVRDAALREVGGFRTGLHAELDSWDLANAVMAAGWRAVTYPALLTERVIAADAHDPPRAGPLLQPLLARFPELVARDAQELVLLLAGRAHAPDHAARPAQPREPTLTSVLRRPLREQLALARRALRQPRRATEWLWRQAKAYARRGLA